MNNVLDGRSPLFERKTIYGRFLRVKTGTRAISMIEHMSIKPSLARNWLSIPISIIRPFATFTSVRKPQNRE